MRLEVRCCCDAHLIGWVEVPPSALRREQVVFALQSTSPRGVPVIGPGEAVETLTFDVGRVGVDRVIAGADFVVLLPDDRNFVALKSRDYPIEQLRRIASFIEATPAQREAGRSGPVHP